MDHIAARIDPRAIHRDTLILIEAIDGLSMALREGLSDEATEILTNKRRWLADRLEEDRAAKDKWERTVTDLFSVHAL